MIFTILVIILFSGDFFGDFFLVFWWCSLFFRWWKNWYPLNICIFHNSNVSECSISILIWLVRRFWAARWSTSSVKSNLETHSKAQPILWCIYSKAKALYSIWALIIFVLEFRLCGLLPSSDHIINSLSKNSKYGKCFEKYGLALSSACIYEQNGTQSSLGLSKGPIHMIRSDEATTALYQLAFTPTDRCQHNSSLMLQLNLIFKCTTHLQ